MLLVTGTLAYGYFSIIRQKLNYTSMRIMSNSNPLLWPIRPLTLKKLYLTLGWLLSWWIKKREEGNTIKDLRSTKSKI